VTVTASASDAVGVSYVQLLVDGLPLGAPVTAAPFSATWDTTGVPNGGHTLSAWAQDAAGNVGFAGKVFVTVSNSGTNPPPPVLLGDQNLEASLYSQPAGQAKAFQYTASTSGTVTQLQLYLDASSTANQVQVGLYADNAGHPGALLSQGTLSAPVARGWNAVPVAPATVTQNTNYWIAILSPNGDHAVNVVKQATGTSLSEFSQQTTLSSLPSSWSSGASSSAGQISAYAVQVAVDGGVNTTYS
jgi:hypothetical protein